MIFLSPTKLHRKKKLKLIWILLKLMQLPEIAKINVNN